MYGYCVSAVIVLHGYLFTIIALDYGYMVHGYLCKILYINNSFLNSGVEQKKTNYFLKLCGSSVFVDFGKFRRFHLIFVDFILFP